MRISIIGLGYVGCVSAGCLAEMGHEVIGVDVHPGKVQAIQEGRPTIIEKGIEALMSEVHQAGRLRATEDIGYAIANSDISFISVGTPGDKNGNLDLSAIYKVAVEIGQTLKDKPDFHAIVIRSTVIPGTTEAVSEKIAQASGKIPEADFSVAVNPEFLREGSAIEDFHHPPLTLIGTGNERVIELLTTLYETIPGEKIVTDIGHAEIAKMVSNAFHALKIVFANEVGNICKALKIDSHKVMDVFCRDNRLNISRAYLKPGFAYGGSCLPKDTRALEMLAYSRFLEVPVLSAISRSNQLQIRHALDLIMSRKARAIGILGLSFKPGTDDLRNSPMVYLAEALLGKGYLLRIYDRNVRLAELSGTNKQFIEDRIPHLQHFIVESLEEVMTSSEIIVIGNKEDFVIDALSQNPGKTVIDLVRIADTIAYQGSYEGISWHVN
jgi:GDP-mannose 6-dehydrogenase